MLEQWLFEQVEHQAIGMIRINCEGFEKFCWKLYYSRNGVIVFLARVARKDLVKL